MANNNNSLTTTELNRLRAILRGKSNKLPPVQSVKCPKCDCELNRLLTLDEINKLNLTALRREILATPIDIPVKE